MSRLARCSTSRLCTASTFTWRGWTPDVAATAAATPESCPIAKAVPWTRNEACDSWEAEMLRPVSSRPSTAFGTRHRYGMSYGPFGLIQVPPPAW